MNDFITRLFAMITSLRTKTGEKLNWLNDNKANDDLSNLSGTLNNTEKSTIRTKIGAVDDTVTDGFVYNIDYEPSTHILTVERQNDSDIIIDLPIEALITNVELNSNNDLVFTFEDGSIVTVPMNTLLAGVVKSVNGKSANSLGEVTVEISDIPQLQSALDGKANINLDNLPSNLSTSERGVIRDKIGVTEAWMLGLLGDDFITTNTNQTGLSGNKTTTGHWTFGSGITVNQTISYGADIRLRFTASNTFISSKTTATTNGIYLRPQGDNESDGQVLIDGAGTIKTSYHGNSSDWQAAYQHSVDMGDATTAVPDWSTELENQTNF